jgi:hypothetical protein
LKWLLNERRQGIVSCFHDTPATEAKSDDQETHLFTPSGYRIGLTISIIEGP